MRERRRGPNDGVEVVFCFAPLSSHWGPDKAISHWMARMLGVRCQSSESARLVQAEMLVDAGSSSKSHSAAQRTLEGLGTSVGQLVVGQRAARCVGPAASFHLALEGSASCRANSADMSTEHRRMSGRRLLFTV